MQAYTNADAKQQWDAKSRDMHRQDDMGKLREFDLQYFQGVDALRTNRLDMMDIALSLCSLSLTLLVGSLCLHFRSWAGIVKLSTPNTPRRIYVI